jgi:hypothetical protein
MQHIQFGVSGAGGDEVQCSILVDMDSTQELTIAQMQDAAREGARALVQHLKDKFGVQSAHIDEGGSW